MDKYQSTQLFLKAEKLFIDNRGLSITEIAKQVCIDRKKLARYLRERGHNFESRKENNEKYEKAIDEYLAGGVTLEQLREKYKLDKSKLSYLLRKRGVVILPSRSLTPNEVKKKKYKIAQVENLFNSGYTVKKISTILKISYYTILEQLEEKGYDTTCSKRTYTLDENIFERIDTREKAYWLAFLYADGYVDVANGKVELTLKREDIEHLRKFQQFLKTDSPLRSKLVILKEKEFEAVRIIICSKKFAEDLAKLGCVNKKSLVLTFPSAEIVPKEFIPDFIRGYYDGDGCIYSHKNGLSATISFVGTENFLNGIQSAMNLPDYKLHQKGEAFQVAYGGNSVIRLMDSLYKNAPVFLERKYEDYKKIIDNREERYQKRLSKINYVVDLYTSGKSTTEIHEETGIQKNLIVNWLEYYVDYVPYRSPTVLRKTEEKTAEILKLLNEGYGLREIDRRVKTSTYRVKMIALRNGFIEPDVLL